MSALALAGACGLTSGDCTGDGSGPGEVAARTAGDGGGAVRAAGDGEPGDVRRDGGAPVGHEGAIAFARAGRGGGQAVHAQSPGEPSRRIAGGGELALFPGPPSPDGRLLALIAVTERPRHAEQLALTRPDGGAVVRVGPASARVRNPSWFPGGRAIAFESDQESFRDLYVLDLSKLDLAAAADGGVVSGELRRLTDDREGNFEPSVSPDGKRVAFVSSRDGNTEIYVVRADGAGERRLTAFHRDDMAPAWSPAGDAIAFVSNREGRDRIFVMRPDGSGQRRVTADQEGDAEERAPVWSPDGERLAFEVHTRDGRSRVAVAPAGGGAHRVLSTGHERARGPCFSADGRHVVFSAKPRAGDSDVYVARIDGTDVHRIAGGAGDDWLPRCLPE